VHQRCSIRTAKEASENAASIYVEIVKPGSLADQVGLEAGDEIIEANGIKLIGLGTQEVGPQKAASSEIVTALLSSLLTSHATRVGGAAACR